MLRSNRCASSTTKQSKRIQSFASLCPTEMFLLFCAPWVPSFSQVYWANPGPGSTPFFFYYNVFTCVRVTPSSVCLEAFRMETCHGILVYCVFFAKHRAVRLPVYIRKLRYLPIIWSQGKSCARERKSSTSNARYGMRWWHCVV